MKTLSTVGRQIAAPLSHWVVKFIIVYTITLGSIQSFAQVRHLIFDDELRRTREEFTFDLDERGELSRYRITGTRYGHPDGEPWLLCHGFLQTEYSLLEYVKGLVEQGKNVFVINEVGFGLEGRRSLLRPGVRYRKGDYGFRGVVTGVSQAVANVSKLTGKPVVLLGFSMGAMASREYIEGTIGEKADGTPLRDESVAVERQKKLKHTILVAGPPDTLEGISAFFKITSSFGYITTQTVAKDSNGFIPLGLGSTSNKPATPSPVVRSVSLLQSLGLFSLVRLAFRDGGNLRNYGTKEKIFDQILQYEFSNPHTDIIKSFARKSVEARDLPPEIGSRSDMKLTVVGAQSDGFVAKYATMDEFKNYYQSNPAQARGIMVTNAGHLDLTGEVVLHQRGLLARLLERNDEPEKYDKHYETYSVLGDPNLILKYQIRNFRDELGNLPELTSAEKNEAPACSAMWPK